MCVDATNYYYRVSHPHASLCAQHFGISLRYLAVIFRTIQNMKMHLRTTFGVSTTFYTSDAQPFQGAVQGNAVALELWIIISIFLIRCFYEQKPLQALSYIFTNFLRYLLIFYA